jgi:putative SOS response-associated peptidase YedK
MLLMRLCVAAGGKKQPYYISLRGDKPVRMAGLYDVYSGGVWAGAGGGGAALHDLECAPSCRKSNATAFQDARVASYINYSIFTSVANH